ncbi:MAG: glycoside hydrolase family 3 C-terminal domain-containing protein [Spirochaetes bacterium]|nr:glycoside hydrolase family 3 C-terminal domain-containing protein [Spirochaetota bacterium]
MIESSDKNRELLQKMTLEEKASIMSGSSFWLLQGIDRLGIPEIRVADGPHGLRKQPETDDNLGIGGSIPATCFPTAVTLASSWDRDLVHRVGQALADECLQEKVSVVLGPGVNIKRSPLCGRNFEYYSEDPLVAGEMSAAFINGVQSRGVGCSLKHFAANNQEYYRLIIDTIVDERTLREIYLRPFEIAVKKAQPWTLMCSYNRINGVYSSDNHWLLTEVLKNEWQHEGIVMTDWGACNDRVQGIRAGLELEMPGSNGINDKKIVEAVRKGLLEESLLDSAVLRMLSLIDKGAPVLKSVSHYDVNEHHLLARSAAEESMVMLKNDSMLPLQKDSSLAVIGDMAVKYRYQGAGSSQIVPTRLSNPYRQMCDYCKVELPYARGYDSSTDSLDSKLIEEAVNVASSVEAVVVFAGLPNIFESEGFDRDHMRLPQNQNALIDALIKTGKPVVVILSNGAPVEIPWLDSCKALLEGYLGGQAGAEAIVRILFGEVNPSGKLAETFPVKIEDTPCFNYFPGNPHQVQYREALYVGYRYYDTVDSEVTFPFGFGLSYTDFAYSDLNISASEINTDETVTVTCKVRNSGKVAGKEIVQIYVSDVESTVYRPKQELKGFAKVMLQPEESCEVSFTLSKEDFAFYDVDSQSLQVESGLFSIHVGASSRDIRLNTQVKVQSDFVPVVSVDQRTALSSYYSPILQNGVMSVDSTTFEALLGQSLPVAETSTRPFHRNSVLIEIQSSWIGRRLYKSIVHEFVKQTDNSNDPTVDLMMRRMLDEMPLRSMVLLSGGLFTERKLNAVLDLLNGRFIRGIKGLLRD